MRWRLRRLFLGDRRKTDRVLTEARSALRRLDQALSSVELATDAEHKRRNNDD